MFSFRLKRTICCLCQFLIDVTKEKLCTRLVRWRCISTEELFSHKHKVCGNPYRYRTWWLWQSNQVFEWSKEYGKTFQRKVSSNSSQCVRYQQNWKDHSWRNKFAMCASNFPAIFCMWKTASAERQRVILALLDFPPSRNVFCYCYNMDRRNNEPEVLLSDMIAICIFDVLDKSVHLISSLKRNVICDRKSGWSKVENLPACLNLRKWTFVVKIKYLTEVVSVFLI